VGDLGRAPDRRRPWPFLPPVRSLPATRPTSAGGTSGGPPTRVGSRSRETAGSCVQW